jgi:hypothetical protein
MKKKVFYHKSIDLAQLDVDRNMQLNYFELKREEIPAEVLLKFKWRVI